MLLCHAAILCSDENFGYWSVALYLIGLDAYAIFGVGDEHGVRLDLLYLVITLVLAQSSNADDEEEDDTFSLRFDENSTGNMTYVYLMPRPGPHEMALSRTSEQLPTIDTQSPPENDRWKHTETTAEFCLSEKIQFRTSVTYLRRTDHS